MYVLSFITYVTEGRTGGLWECRTSGAELWEMGKVDSHCGQRTAWCRAVFCAVLWLFCAVLWMLCDCSVLWLRCAVLWLCFGCSVLCYGCSVTVLCCGCTVLCYGCALDFLCSAMDVLWLFYAVAALCCIMAVLWLFCAVLWMFCDCSVLYYGCSVLCYGCSVTVLCCGCAVLFYGCALAVRAVLWMFCDCSVLWLRCAVLWLCCVMAVLCCAMDVLWLFCGCAVLCYGCTLAVLIDMPSLTLNSPQICTGYATRSAEGTATSGRRNPFQFQFICHAKSNLATFEVPTAVLLLSQFFWGVTLHALLGPENEGVMKLWNFENYCPSDTVSPRREQGCSNFNVLLTVHLSIT